MSYFRTCPHCGAHLDPGEICQDCQEKTASSAANTEGGKVEQIERAVSASILH